VFLLPERVLRRMRLLLLLRVLLYARAFWRGEVAELGNIL